MFEDEREHLETEHEGAAAADAARPMQWYDFLEDACASWAEQAQGYRLMHEKAYSHYNKISFKLTIPAIILSTLTGVANFGQDSLSPLLGSNVALYIGVLSIIAAMLSTVAKYVRADEKAETHRNSMVMWDKLYRTIVTELTQPRANRSDPQEFLISYREERHRLSEQSPTIPYKIRNWFKAEYKQDYDTGVISPPNILRVANVEVYRGQRSRNVLTHMLYSKQPHEPPSELDFKKPSSAESDDSHTLEKARGALRPRQEVHVKSRSPFKHLGQTMSQPVSNGSPAATNQAHRSRQTYDAKQTQTPLGAFQAVREIMISAPPVLDHVMQTSLTEQPARSTAADTGLTSSHMHALHRLHADAKDTVAADVVGDFSGVAGEFIPGIAAVAAQEQRNERAREQLEQQAQAQAQAQAREPEVVDDDGHRPAAGQEESGGGGGTHA